MARQTCRHLDGQTVGWTDGQTNFFDSRLWTGPYNPSADYSYPPTYSDGTPFSSNDFTNDYFPGINLNKLFFFVTVALDK
jgi:hypothetical protein